MIRGDYLLQARAKAAKLCAFKERAPIEIREKLTKWELNEEEISEIIEFLKAENYLDEQRFADAFCHDKFEFNQWGRIKIRMMISKFKLPKHIVESGLAKINQERYFATILKLSKKKWSSLHSEKNPFTKKHKTVTYLVGKGFETDHCWAAVNKLS